MKMLTLEDRKELERMWSENAAPVKMAAALDISLCTVYAELKRGQATDGDGEVVPRQKFPPCVQRRAGAVYLQPQPPKPGTPPESGKKLNRSGEMIIDIKAAFPLEWGKEYYTVDSAVKQVRAACVCCDNTGTVTIKGTEYKCRGRGNGVHRFGRRWRRRCATSLLGRMFVQFVALCCYESLSERVRQLKLSLGSVNGDPAHDNKVTLDRENKLKSWLKNTPIYLLLQWFDAVEEVKLPLAQLIVSLFVNFIGQLNSSQGIMVHPAILQDFSA